MSPYGAVSSTSSSVSSPAVSRVDEGRHDRAEELLLHQPDLGIAGDHDRRLDEEALAVVDGAADEDLRVVRAPRELDRLAVPREGLAVDHRAHEVGEVADASHATNLAFTLRSGTSHVQRLSRLWGRNGLVTAQVALALVLLTVTVYLGRAFRAELSEPGFRTEGMLLASFDPRLAGYDGVRTEAFYRQLSERVKALPGVTSVGDDLDRSAEPGQPRAADDRA